MQHSATSRQVSGNSPIESVLERLGPQRRSGPGWTARCPAHDDKYPSLSIREGDDGKVLLNCFAGCTVDEIVKAIGLRVEDLFPPRRDFTPIPRSPREPITIPLGTARRLVRGPEFAFIWEAAKLLALFEPRQARAEVVRNWAFLTSRCNVELLLRTTYLLRGVALFRYCDSRGADDHSARERSIRKLVEEAEDDD